MQKHNEIKHLSSITPFWIIHYMSICA